MTCLFSCRLWDIAQVIPKERISAGESFDGVVKLLRLATFVLLFVLLLGCVTVAQACILILESAIAKVTTS